MRTARSRRGHEGARTRAMSSAVMARGTCQPGPNGIADGAMVSHGSSPCFKRLAAFPWPLRRGLASRMGDLDAELGRADAAAMVDHARERRLAGVGIEAEAAMGDAPVPLHMGGLDDQEAGAAIGEHAQMREMPVVGTAVIGAVLAHGRDDDAVGEIELGKPERREQGTGHGNLHLRRMGQGGAALI